LKSSLFEEKNKNNVFSSNKYVQKQIHLFPLSGQRKILQKDLNLKRIHEKSIGYQ